MSDEQPVSREPKLGVIDITEFPGLTEEEQVVKVKELLRMIAPKSGAEED